MVDSNDFRKYAVQHHGMSGTKVDDYMKFVSETIPRIENTTTTIIEERPIRVSVMDVFSRLIMDRIIFFGTPVYDEIANIVVAQMLYLESADAKKDIMMYINSPGGSVHAGLGIYDTMQYIKPDVATICTSMAASMGAVLLSGGAAGKRSALPHARVMIHQPSGGMQGKSTDMEVAYEQMMILRNELYVILSKHSGVPLDKVKEDSEKSDKWMKAEEAKKYGLIDEVLTR